MSRPVLVPVPAWTVTESLGAARAPLGRATVAEPACSFQPAMSTAVLPLFWIVIVVSVGFTWTFVMRTGDAVLAAVATGEAAATTVPVTGEAAIMAVAAAGEAIVATVATAGDTAAAWVASGEAPATAVAAAGETAVATATVVGAVGVGDAAHALSPPSMPTARTVPTSLRHVFIVATSPGVIREPRCSIHTTGCICRADA